MMVEDGGVWTARLQTRIGSAARAGLKARGPALRAALASVILASCATITPPGASTPSGPPSIPSAPLALGDYRGASPSAVLSQFERGVSSRYAAGLALNAVSADLRRNAFTCAPGASSERGDPPAQICRQTLSANACTHTWQVHLYDRGGDSQLARTRALYDRRCGDDGLLGGPG